ncbi:hypothetical protein [Candidatus Palauibacter sp.]|uniref:hypothetical protein n=1 Tax=Candidatus Palauibacter sp. TaxID=3101350 RepID=UPI003B029CE4
MIWLARTQRYGQHGTIKVTIVVHDELLLRAKRYARESGQSLRSVVEEGLRRVLAVSAAAREYRLPDLSYGNPSDEDPLGVHSWEDLSEMIYEAGR